MITRMLDSVILIDHLNGVSRAKNFIFGLDPSETAISVITRSEILSGIDEKSESVVKILLDYYHLFVIDRGIADLAATLRKIHGWKLPDAFQAALCLHHKFKFATRNTKDFNPEKHDFVEIPYTL